MEKCLLEKWHKFPVIDKQSYYKKLTSKCKWVFKLTFSFVLWYDVVTCSYSYFEVVIVLHWRFLEYLIEFYTFLL